MGVRSHSRGRRASRIWSGERAIGAAVRYFAERAPIPRFFQVHRGDRHYESGKIAFTTFCSELGLP